MRKRKIQSAVPAAVQAEVLQEGPGPPEPPRQFQQPRDLSQMGTGALKPVTAKAVSFDPKIDVGRSTPMHKPHKAKWAAKGGAPLYAEAQVLGSIPGPESVAFKGTTKVQEFATMSKGQGQFKMARKAQA